MGVQTFIDTEGREWRVWRVDSPTASAHLIDASFRHGWLAFERADGQERRRLPQIPEDWDSLPPDRLAALCQIAGRVDPSRTGTTGQRAPLPPPPEARKAR